MFAAIQAQRGGVNQWFDYRAPTPRAEILDGTWTFPAVKPSP